MPFQLSPWILVEYLLDTTDPRGSIRVTMAGCVPRLYTEEEKVSLKRAYEEGLDSTKRENLPQILEIAKRLKRSEEEIKVSKSS